MTSQIKFKNWHNFGSRLEFNFRIWKVFNKKKLYKIRCRSWSVVATGLNNLFRIPRFKVKKC